MSDTLLPETSKSAIISFALKTGFDVVKITDPYGLEKNAGFFTKYLKQSFHGDMKWMEEKADRRKSPLTLWPEVKSIIMVGMNYGPGENPLDFLANKNIGNISVYAGGRDYHDVVKKRLKQIARYIRCNTNFVC